MNYTLIKKNQFLRKYKKYNITLKINYKNNEKKVDECHWMSWNSEFWEKSGKR